MNRQFQVSAVVLWLTSLALPTIPTLKNGNLLGFELLTTGVMGAFLLPFSLFYPAHLLSLFINYFLVREIFYFFLPARKEVNLPSLSLLALAFLLNTCIGFSTLGKSSDPALLAGILRLPGFYVWLAAFFMLMLVRMKGDEPIKNNQITN